LKKLFEKQKGGRFWGHSVVCGTVYQQLLIY